MPARFDVFLSHASTDKPLVEELARRLTRENLKPWLDKWNLIPGTAWQPEIENVLADCVTCAVIIGSGGFGPWHHEEMRLAIGRRVENREHVFRVIPVLLPGVERPERSKLPGFLTATTWVEFRDTLDDPEAFYRLLCGIRGIEPGERAGGAAFEGKNPYRGLELFDVEHAPLFFGREALTEWLLDALKRKPSGVENRFLAIVGASGSGKSSLARAGLLAALKDGKLDASHSWPQAICRPGSEPFFNLANALKGVAHESDRALVFDRLQGRKDGERSLHVAAGLVLGEPPRAERLVLLVDQFEEVFTLCDDEPKRRDFIANLLHAATVAGGRAIVVLTMRADFYPRCASYADLAAALSDHQVLVGPMTEDELRRAIDRPARLAGLEPEPGLIELLVDDIRGRAGALPLLQFALQEVWRRREDYRLTIRTYREIGQLEGALQRKADAVYGSFTPEQKELCRRVFLRLVQPGEGSEDTRRRASLRELLPDDPTTASAVQAIITRLSDPESRLLTTGRQQTASGEGTLEVAHEALIRDWPQLRAWIETDRAGLRTHLRLTDAAKEWEDAVTEAKESALYSGARLAVATEWAASHRGELGALEAAFLSASQEHERQKRADEAEKNRRLAEAEHQRAEEAEARKREAEEAAWRQKKLSQWLRVAAAIMLVLFVAAVWVSWQAMQATGEARTKAEEAKKSEQRATEKEQLATTAAEAARKSAEAARKSEERATEKEKLATENEKRAIDQAAIATSRQLTAFSVSERNRRLDRSLLLAVEAVRKVENLGPVNSFEARENLLKALQDRPELTSFLHIQEGNVSSVAFSTDGKTIAAGYGYFGVSGRGVGGVVVWDAAGRKRLSVDPLVVKEGQVSSVAFSPDGKTIAAGYGGGRGGVVLWDTAGRKRLSEEPLVVKEGGVRSVAFSTDGKTIAAGYVGGVVLWDAAGRKRLSEEPLAVNEGGVNSVAFSRDCKTIAAGYSIGGVGGVVVWDAAGRKRLSEKPLVVKEGEVRSVAFSTDGKTIAAGYSVRGGGGGGGGVVFWDAAGRKRLPEKPLVVKEGGVRSVAFSTDGKTIAAGYGDSVVGGVGGVVLWDAAGRKRLSVDPLVVKEGQVSSLAFSPDCKTIAASYGYFGVVVGGVVVWDAAGRKRLSEKPLVVKKGQVSSVAFSPDGKTIAAGYNVREVAVSGVVVWDAAGRKRLPEEPLVVKEGYVNSVAFSPDGKTIAAGYSVRDVVGGVSGGVVVWDAAARKRLPEEPLVVKEGYVNSVAFSPDGKTIAAGYSVRDVVGGVSGGVVVWDAAGRKRLSQEPLVVKESYVTSVAFSPDCKTIAAGYSVSGGVGGGVVVWDAAGRKRLSEEPLAVNEGGVSSVAFSPDGKTIAAGYSDSGGGVGGVVLWDAVGRKRLSEEPLVVKEGRVNSVAFSTDAKTIAAGYSDSVVVGGVVLWDAAGRKRLSQEPLVVKESYVTSVAFSPDAKTIAAGYSGVSGGVGSVVLCDVDLESWQRRAARIANRNFTWAEWRQYFPDTTYRATFPDLPVPPEAPSQKGEKRP